MDEVKTLDELVSVLLRMDECIYDENVQRWGICTIAISDEIDVSIKLRAGVRP